jgi:hypothetical protein
VGMLRSSPRRALVLVVLALLGSGALPGSARGGDQPPVGPLEPTSGSLFGAYVKSESGWTRDDATTSIEALEADLGRPLGIDHHYHPWSLPFPTWREPWDHAMGRIPMISWGDVSTKKVNSGSLDAVIRSRAEAVRDLGHPLFIRWFAEMDGDAMASRSRSPGSYIRAWRRIRWIFGTAGAWNAVWVWCPTAWGFVEGTAQRFYPGDEYVDWVCSDGYNWAPGRKGDEWRSFHEIYEAFYEFGLARDKPMMAGEYGCQERDPGEKAAWINQAREDIKARFPELDAVVYFDSNRDYDWRVDTSASSYQAFISMSQDSYFNPRTTSLGAVDAARFDGILADGTAPRVRVRSRSVHSGRRDSVRWRSDEPHRDVVRLRYEVQGGNGRVIVRSTADDGRYVWDVPIALRGKRIRVLVTSTDLAGNVGTARSRWFKVA